MTKTKFSIPKTHSKPKGHGLSSYMGKSRAKDFIVCSECGTNEIGMYSKTFSFSSKKWGRPVCWSCQKKGAVDEKAEAQADFQKAVTKEEVEEHGIR